MSRGLRRGTVAAALALTAIGCAAIPRIERSELPDAPIAVLYRTPEESRRRAELLQKLRGEGARRDDAAILDFDEMRRVLGRSGDELAAGRLALLDPRTGSIQVLTSAPRGARPLDWSNDRRTLLFAASRDGTRQLFTLDRESGEVRPVTAGRRAHPQGCLLPDGRFVAVEQRGRGAALSARLVLFGPGGIPLRELTSGPTDVQPTCDPNGRYVAFVRLLERDRTDVLALDLTGDGAPRTLARGLAPTFGPQGEWIVYSAGTSRGPRLWRVHPDGSGRRTLGVGVADETDPAVSPDGRFVAYGIEDNDRQWLRVKRVDGGGDRPLYDDGDALAPVW